MTRRPTRDRNASADRAQRARRTCWPIEPDGRSWTVRENLADILRREILGPADGPDEVIEVAPDTRYLVGRIAPVRLINRPDKQADVDDDEVLAADLMDLPEGRGVPARRYRRQRRRRGG